MRKAFQVALLIVVPLVWGLLADLVFEQIRRRYFPSNRQQTNAQDK